jgi:acyl-CoA reductase-like NAD-dependent aldehyde dehydrogenase
LGVIEVGNSQFLNRIGDGWVAAVSGQEFMSVNPARPSTILGTFPRSGAGDLDLAAKAARAAFPAWRKLPAEARAQFLSRAATLLRERKQELAEVITRDTGKVTRNAIFEVEEAIDAAEYAEGVGRWPSGETVPSELSDRTCFTWREPLGVVGVITPGPFPIGVGGGRIFSALVAGNTVVFRPSEDAPLAAHRFVELLLDAGFPPGVLNLLQGYDNETIPALVSHPYVSGISFTGSNETGRAIAVECARQLKRVGLVLASKNSIVVMDDADLDVAVEAAIWAAFGASGQRTTAASRLVVHRKRLAEFSERFARRSQELRIGDGLLEGSEIGPLINEVSRRRMHDYAQIGTNEGATIVAGGRMFTDGPLADGFFYPPTVLGGVTPKMRVAQEVIYGPVVAIIAADTPEQAIEYANSTDYGLTLSIYTRDLSRAFRSMHELQSGVVYVNAGTQGEVQLPFGGVKASGNGRRTGGTPGLDEFAEWKAVYVDHH